MSQKTSTFIDKQILKWMRGEWSSLRDWRRAVKHDTVRSQRHKARVQLMQMLDV
jgi:hypothetical protein